MAGSGREEEEAWASGLPPEGSASGSARIALYPGSFDPVTLGHLDIIERATRIFDRVVVAVLQSATKTSLFTAAERMSLLEASTQDMSQVAVTSFDGLTVDCARNVGASTIVRGLRAVSDFEGEFQMALMNRRLAPEIHTVFLMTSLANVFVSSSIVRDVCRHGGDISGLAPAPSILALQKKLRP